MSGKGTLLRTVGINTVLAMSGASVRASSLRVSALAIGATLRIQDSLQEGRSRFFAEIARIRQLAQLADGSYPLLFLLDELFHGTNSHDRLIGASGVLESLLDSGAIGLITTRSRVDGHRRRSRVVRPQGPLRGLGPLCGSQREFCTRFAVSRITD